MKVSELKYGMPIRVRIPSYEASGYPAEFDTDFIGYHDGFVVIYTEPYSDVHIMYDGVLPEWCSAYDLQSNEWVGITNDEADWRPKCPDTNDWFDADCCTNYEHEDVAADNVNRPTHYTQGRRELIDIMSDTFTNEEFKGFLKCNCLKYLARYKHKNGIEDLKKADWYLNKLIEVEETKDREEI